MSAGTDGGSPTAQWRTIAEREVATRIRDKTFLAATAFSMVLVVGVIAVTAFLGSRSTTHEVAVVDRAGAEVVEAADQLVRASGDDATVEAVQVADPDAADRQVRAGDADAALLSAAQGFEIVGDEEVDAQLEESLRSAISSTVVARNAADQGVDLGALRAGSTAEVRLLTPQPADADARSAVAFAFALIFLMTAIAFGMTMAQSVVQEKESRIVEILAAAVPLRAMLWGKIAGNTVLALVQILLVVVIGVLALAVTGRGELLAGIGPAVAWYVVLFVLGFVTLASLWSVAGALASRQEDLQSTTLPGQMLLFVPYFVSIFGSEGVKTVFSMLPVVSTMTMPGRMAEGGVPAWQVAVAIASTVVAAVVFVRLGERVYARGLLQTSGKLGYREALRSAD